MSDKLPIVELDELPYLDGRAWTFGDGLTCEQIILAGAHGLEVVVVNPPLTSIPEVGADDPSLTRLGERLRREMQRGDFLVAGSDFASGGVPSKAVWSLKRAGIGAVIARSYSSGFCDAAVRVGLPALLVEETAAIKDGDRLRVDVEGHKVVNLSSGDRYVIRNIHGQDLDTLRAGGLPEGGPIKA